MYGEGLIDTNIIIYEQKSLLSCGLNSKWSVIMGRVLLLLSVFLFLSVCIVAEPQRNRGSGVLWQLLYWSMTGAILVCDRYYTGLWQVLYWSMTGIILVYDLWQVLYWSMTGYYTGTGLWSMTGTILVYDRYCTGLWHVLYWSTASNIAYQSVVLINVISIRNLQSAFSDSKHFTNIFLYSLKSVA